MPCYPSLETYLDAYLDGCALRGDAEGPLLRTIERGRAVLTATPLPQANANAILDRLVHNAHRLELSGESMRRSAPPSQA